MIVAQEVATGQRHVVLEERHHGPVRTAGLSGLCARRPSAGGSIRPARARDHRAERSHPGGVGTDIGLGIAQFDVSTNGLLAYVPGGGIRAQRDLVFVDGKESDRPDLLGRPYNLAKLSPDGRRIATELTAADNDIWTYDITSGALTRLTFEGENQFPVWSPDGRTVLVQSDRGSPGVFNLFALPQPAARPSG